MISSAWHRPVLAGVIAVLTVTLLAGCPSSGGAEQSCASPPPGSTPTSCNDNNL
ncbi:hypothetical protein [Winogradskya humida]|uniref:hypothetical protein n=1 Tax=Winogradskya humida TaxID=113566 RepID=UPI001942A0BE|nr:hypothetical protein [Actinoplanes humidus]